MPEPDTDTADARQNKWDREDAEFEAALRMKNEPLVLDEVEAKAFDELKRKRAKRLAKPLPIEKTEKA